CGGQRNADSAPDVTIKHDIKPEPLRKGEVTVTLTLEDAGGKPVEKATLRDEGNMSHAGMKPVFGDGRETEPGKYEVPLKFTMGGDWFLIVTGTLADGRRLQRKIDVPGVLSK